MQLAILAAVPSIAALLAAISRRRPHRVRKIAVVLAIFLALNELVWYAYLWRHHEIGFPDGLPLELCDVTLWLTVIAIFARRPAIFDFVYLAGISGSGMALVTPDLWAPFSSYPTIHFFLQHGGIVGSVLFMVWSGDARPRPGCVWRVLLAINAYAAALGVFDAAFHTDYMYLCTKPESASILDWFGPWPFYLLGGEAVALALFWLLWLPFRVPGVRDAE